MTPVRTYWKHTRAICRHTLLRAVAICLLLCMLMEGHVHAELAATGGVTALMRAGVQDGIGIETTFDGFGLLAQFDLLASSVFCGLASLKWGPGRSGSLVMSGRVPSMPVVGYALDRGRVSYIRFAGLMEPEQSRRILGHRLEYRPNEWLHLGISETAILSGDASSIMYWPFPGLPLYALQRVAYQRDRSQSAKININLDLEARMYIEPFLLEHRWITRAGTSCVSRDSGLAKAEIYGELFIDDAQGYLRNRETIPDLVGGLVGLDVPIIRGDQRFRLNVEYVAIANHVYSTRNADSDYVFCNMGIGHPLGPDADMIVATVSFEPQVGTRILLRGSVERHGEGRIGDPWTPEDGKENMFLSGVVEKTAKASLECRRILAGPAYVFGSSEASMTRDYAHVLGLNRCSLSFAVGLGIEL